MAIFDSEYRYQLLKKSTLKFMKTPLQLSDGALLNSLVFLAAEEKKCTAKVVLHLAEVDARKLFCELKYASLFDYCVGELGYSEAQAWRRVGAARLVKKSKAVREKVKRGNLSVTNAAMVGSFLRDKPKENVEELVEKVEGKSKRECEKFLNGLRGTEPRPKKTVVKEGEQSARVSLTLPTKTWAKLKRLKNLHAHKGWDLAVIIDHMAEAELAAFEKKKTVVRAIKTKVKSTSPGKSVGEKSKQNNPSVKSVGEKSKQNNPSVKSAGEKLKQTTSPGESPSEITKKNTSPGKSVCEKLKQATSLRKSAAAKPKQVTSPGKSIGEKLKQTTSLRKSATAKQKQVTSPGKLADEKTKQITPPEKPPRLAFKNHRRYIKKSIRAQVWTEAGGRCQHCGSERALEFDHCKPFAWGGGSVAANLRLLCRECNRRQAVKAGLGHYAGKVAALKTS